MVTPATGAMAGTDTGDRAGARAAGRMPRSARRKQLLVAAREVFVAQGYHAAAMDDIAERAGVSKPVLYQHFPGKLDLYLALLDTFAEALVHRVRQAMASTTDNTVRVHNAITAYFDFVDGEGPDEEGAFRLVFETDLRNEPAVRERVERTSRLCMEAIADTIAADTGLPRPQAELLSVALTGLSEMAARWWLDTDRAVPKADAVWLLETLAWRGISHFPRQG
jgi:AcrR family transcriptional regulator